MSQPIMQALRRSETGHATKWTVNLRDKSGRAFPVLVESATAEYLAVSAAMNKAEKFLPGHGWRPISARRTL